MPNMPGSVTKTRTFTAMDSIWSGDPETRMTEYDSAASVQALLTDAVNKQWISPQVKKHVEDHWLQKYWPPKPHADEVLQRGLYWAMRVAAFHDGDLNRRRKDEQGNPNPLPIYCAWVCSGGKAKKEKPRFELISMESDQQVTLLFLTPPPKGLWGDKPLGPPQRIWSTRHKDFGADQGEKQLETWQQTVTVRPYDYEDFTPPTT